MHNFLIKEMGQLENNIIECKILMFSIIDINFRNWIESVKVLSWKLTDIYFWMSFRKHYVSQIKYVNIFIILYLRYPLSQIFYFFWSEGVALVLFINNFRLDKFGFCSPSL